MNLNALFAVLFIVGFIVRKALATKVIARKIYEILVGDISFSNAFTKLFDLKAWWINQHNIQDNLEIILDLALESVSLLFGEFLLSF